MSNNASFVATEVRSHSGTSAAGKQIRPQSSRSTTIVSFDYLRRSSVHTKQMTRSTCHISSLRPTPLSQHHARKPACHWRPRVFTRNQQSRQTLSLIHCHAQYLHSLLPSAKAVDAVLVSLMASSGLTRITFPGSSLRHPTFSCTSGLRHVL
jgi:hypothetical protein